MQNQVVTQLIRIIGVSIGLVAGFACTKTRTPEPRLDIKSPEKTISYKRSELLSRKDVQQIQIQEDPTYPGRIMNYTAVPLYALFEEIDVPVDATLLFRCRDGFSAPISQKRLLNRSPDKAVAYLAIEKEGEQWPTLSKSTDLTSAGPFYVIWLNAKYSQIGQEEWPFQVVSFEVQKSIKTLYPKIFPDQGLLNDHPVQKGFQIFTKTCFTCHTLNLQGTSHVGPDLNVPMSPVEYLQSFALKKLVRNPQDLRHWPNGKMPGFSKEVISDNELEDLIQYLKYMSKNRK
jgi:mono/diheme cytochrome c family protein